MAFALNDAAKLPTTHTVRNTLARTAGMIVIGSTLVGALLFRTYGLEVTPIAWEMVRHFNVFFLACEIAVVAIGISAGLDIRGAWSRLGRGEKAALLIWLATFWIGSLRSEQPGYSLVLAIGWPIHVLFGLSIWHLARYRRGSVADSVGVIGSGAAAVVAGLLMLTAAHFMLAPDLGPLPDGQIFWSGAIPGFMSVRMFGIVMAYAALCGAGMLLTARDPRRHVHVPAALLVVGTAALCWSSTRAAVPAFSAAVLLLPVLARHRAAIGRWLMVSACILIGFVVSIAVPAPDANYGTLAMFGIGDAGAGEQLTSGRLEIWRQVLGAIVDRPLIGSGEGATRWLIASGNGIHVQPHNVILQLFLHWGAVAAMAALWLSGRLGFALIAAVRHEPASLPLAMIVAASVIAALFDGALYYPHVVIFPVAALAFALAPRSGESVPQSTVL